jgi:malonyl-ACP decarboxylase
MLTCSAPVDMAAQREPAVVTGRGIVTSIGTNLAAFSAALRAGRSGVARLPADDAAKSGVPVAARIDGLDWKAALEELGPRAPEAVARSGRILRNAPESARWTALAVLEAWIASGLGSGAVPAERIGLIVAGNNLHQSFIHRGAEQFLAAPEYLNARYAVCYFDTFQVGALSELLGLRGPGITVGGASASGNLALQQALLWLRAGLVDACVVAGAAAELSPMELRGFATIGAAYCAPDERDPVTVCRPFDVAHAGFVYGQGSACLVLETPATARRRGAKSGGELAGAASCLDGNHLPDPSTAGEVRAMRAALDDAGRRPDEIGYLNAHGSGSPIGDDVECAAIGEVFGAHAAALRVNSTKPLTGHCLQSAGVVEAVATLLQLEERFVHPNPNLAQPITDQIGFVRDRAEPLAVTHALSNSFGFGGINSAILLARGI